MSFLGQCSNVLTIPFKLRCHWAPDVFCGARTKDAMMICSCDNFWPNAYILIRISGDNAFLREMDPMVDVRSLGVFISFNMP